MFLRGTVKPGALNGFFSFSFYAKDEYFVVTAILSEIQTA